MKNAALVATQRWWAALPGRERRLLLLAGGVLGLFLLWVLALQPALQTLRSAPAELDALDAQWQTMQRLAAEATELRATPPVSPDQAAAALTAATERLGDKAKLLLQGDRAVLTLNGLGTNTLRDWLAEARSGARARPVEANLLRNAQGGYSGTLVLSLGGNPTGKLRWALLGGMLGALLALGAFAPAAWLASALARASGERLLLADARGTVWRGSAVLVLTGGPGSRDASALPGRLDWTLGLDGAALALRARQACCINGELRLRVQPGLGRLRVEVPGATGAAPGPSSQGPAPLGQWPASWLVGLGTPWNTLQPSGSLRLLSPGLTLELVQGRWLFGGLAQLDLLGMASRLSTLPVLGSYRLTLSGDAAGSGPARLQLQTIAGALQLQGSGSLLGAGAASTLRFNGQASAEAGAEAQLANLLNIIGRRQGAVSVIAIG